MTIRRYGISEAAGVVVIYSTAVLLHFIHGLSGGGTLAVIFGAVNESVWEHVKIFSISYCGYAILQLLWLKVPFRRYVVGKCVGLYLLIGGMIGFFYLYTGIAGAPILWLDITSSAALTALAQQCSFLLTVKWKKGGEFFAPAVLMIMLYYLMFFCFTVFPPRIGLFLDPVTGGYGIPEI